MTDRKPHRIHCVVGTRPNFVKIAPIVKALQARTECDPHLIHTGQHYDFSMDRVFFEELRIPEPDVNLKVGSGTGGEVVARVILALQPLLVETQPDLMIVVGDVNSTVAAALTARYLKFPLLMSRLACAASIAACQRRSIDSSSIRCRTCISSPSATVSPT